MTICRHDPVQILANIYIDTDFNKLSFEKLYGKRYCSFVRVRIGVDTVNLNTQEYR